MLQFRIKRNFDNSIKKYLILIDIKPWRIGFNF